MKSIVLVGFMGSGKTAVGRILAERLGVPLVDLDAEIERLEGRTVGQIFAEEGESYFRSREVEVLRSLRGEDKVLSVGGGAYTTDDNIALINSRAVAVWLDCRLDVCLQRCKASPTLRPLFTDPEEYIRLYKHRRRFYSRAHHYIDSSDDTPEETADKIIAELGFQPKQ